MEYREKKLRIIKVLYALFFVMVFFPLLSACGGETKILGVPQNLRIEYNVLYWDEVENASGYIIFMEDKEYETSVCSFDLKTVLFEDDKVEIEVMAMGDGQNYDNSGLASALFTGFSKPVDAANDDAGFSYTLLSDGSGYSVSRGSASLDGRLVIPSYFYGLPVKEIADAGFVNRDVGGSPVSIWKITENIRDGRNYSTTEIILPEKLEKIGMRALSCFMSVEEIVLPDSVKTLGMGCFGGNNSLKRINIPENVKIIPDQCFAGCALDSVDLPDGLESIGQGAFRARYEGVRDNGDYFVLTTNQKFTDIVVPATVKKIGHGAFAYCSRLKNIRMSGELEYLGSNVFQGTEWYNTQPFGLVVYDDILLGYKGACEEKVLTVPKGIGYIADYAFSRQTAIEEIILPEGVKLLGNGIFDRCVNLKFVTLPEDWTVIPDRLFAGLENLTAVNIPDGVIRIGVNSFYDCKSLESITLPSGLKEIGNGAFATCRSLRYVIIPGSVQKIGNGPFMQCDNLARVYYEGNSSDWDKLIKEYNPPMETEVPGLDPFSYADVYFYSPEQPVVSGNFWRYENGAPVVWKKV